VRNLPSPFGLRTPFGGGDRRWLTNYSEDFVSDPPEFSFTSSRSGTWTWDFHSTTTPPLIGAGNIATGTDIVVAGLNTKTVDLSAHPLETGYLYHRVTDGSGNVSNILRSSQFTVPAAPSADVDILDTLTASSVAGGTTYTLSGINTVADGRVILNIMHYNGTARTTTTVKLDTVAGADFTLIGTEATSSGLTSSWWYLDGVTAGAHDVYIVTNLGVTNIRIRSHRVVNANIGTALVRSQVGASVSSRSVSGNIGAGGAILAAASSSTTFTDVDFTGVTEYAAWSGSTNLGRVWGREKFPSAVVGQTVTATGTGGPSSMVLSALWLERV
jgi:hypothetical protein